MCEAIDDLISVQVEARPRKSDRRIRLIAQEARALQGGMSLPAAQAAVDGLAKHATAVVSSGWVIPNWYPRGELCGTIGSLGLVRFFVMAMQKKVLFPTEEDVVPVIERLCSVAGLRTVGWEEFISADYPQVCVLPFPKDDAAAASRSVEILRDADPGVLITVEKCGPGPKGIFHTGNGMDMSQSTARINVLMEAFKSAGVTTIGVGDLGNELGFGKIRDKVIDILDDIQTCYCGCGEGIVTSTESDFLVVGSASNRAATGLEAGIAALTGQGDLMSTSELSVRLTQEAAMAGALDSYYVGPTSTDGHGVPAPLNGAITDLLRFISMSSRITYPLYKARD